MNLVGLWERIGLEDLPEDPLARLQAVHRAFSYSIPYENLAILEGESIRLDVASLYEKIILRRRGGYCYELNGVLAQVLEELDFCVQHLLSRVWANGHPAPPLTHMVLRVTVAGQGYLCDVGFGVGTLREPVPWILDQSVRQDPDLFRLVETDNQETMLQVWAAGRWKDLYSVISAPVRPQDVIPANHYSSTHPDSFFTRAPMAALNTAEGRVTLHGRTLRRWGGGGVQETEISDLDELLQVLALDFGLADLNRPELAARLSDLWRID